MPQRILFREDHRSFVVCPDCGHDFDIVFSAFKAHNEKEGEVTWDEWEHLVVKEITNMAKAQAKFIRNNCEPSRPENVVFCSTEFNFHPFSIQKIKAGIKEKAEYVKLTYFTKYKHHETEVLVRGDLKGRHKDFCMCYMCDSFNPEEREKNCPIANHIFNLCVSEHLVLPVWECPKFKPSGYKLPLLD